MSGQPHLLHVFPSFGQGGQQARLATIANAFGERCRHTVISLDADHAAREWVSDSVPMAVRAMPLRKGRTLSLGNLRAIRRELAQAAPSLLVTYNWGAIEWALANRLGRRHPHVHHEDGFGPDESPARQHRRRVLVRRLALGGRSRLVVPSRLLADLAERVWRLPPSRIAYVPNGIDCERFARPPDAALVGSWPVAAGQLVIGAVGALRREKNLHRLLRAVAGLRMRPQPVVVLVGEGPEREPLAATAAELGLAERVVFTGRVAAPEALIGAFDVVALSSDTEQMPYSVIEAMAAGRAVVATDVGDIRAMVSEENIPFIVSPADEAALTRALDSLLAAPALRATVGTANRAKARATFDLAAMLERYEALYTLPRDRNPHPAKALPVGVA